jgi:hypothetical protein
MGSTKQGIKDFLPAEGIPYKGLVYSYQDDLVEFLLTFVGRTRQQAVIVVYAPV